MRKRIIVFVSQARQPGDFNAGISLRSPALSHCTCSRLKYTPSMANHHLYSRWSHRASCPSSQGR